MRSEAIVDVAMNTKNAAHPATEKKFLRLILQMPWSCSGGRSCFGFFTETAAIFATGTGEEAIAGGFGEAATGWADDGLELSPGDAAAGGGGVASTFELSGCSITQA